MATWALTDFCTYDTLTAEVGRTLGFFLQLEQNDAAIPAIVAEKIVVAKAELEERLMDVLPPLFVSKTANWIRLGVNPAIGADYQTGRTWTELDTMLDKLLNPSVFQRTMHALTVVLLIEEGQRRSMANYSQEQAGLTAAHELWTNQVERRLDRALKRLQIDLNEDGTAQDAERPRDNTIIWPC